MPIAPTAVGNVDRLQELGTRVRLVERREVGRGLTVALDRKHRATQELTIESAGNVRGLPVDRHSSQLVNGATLQQIPRADLERKLHLAREQGRFPVRLEHANRLLERVVEESILLEPEDRHGELRRFRTVLRARVVAQGDDAFEAHARMVVLDRTLEHRRRRR